MNVEAVRSAQSFAAITPDMSKGLRICEIDLNLRLNWTSTRIWII